MSLIFVDGFDHCTDVTLKWDYGTGVIAAGTGRFSSGGLLITGNQTVVRYVTARSEVWGGFAVKVGDAKDTFANLFYLWDSVKYNIPFLIQLRNDGRLRITGGSDGGQAGSPEFAVSTLTLPLNQWNYMEFHSKIHASTGVAEVKVNGTVYATFTGNTVVGTSTDFSTIVCGGSAGYGGPWQRWLDDLYLDDAAYLGDVVVQAIYPTGAGTYTEFTPAVPPNWSQVDESTPDGDVSYVYSSTVGQRDTYAFSNIDTAAGTIFGVAANICSAKTEPGERTIKPIVYSGAALGEAATITPGSSYKVQQVIMEVNPVTSSAWAISEVNSYEYGQKIES